MGIEKFVECDMLSIDLLYLATLKGRLGKLNYLTDFHWKNLTTLLHFDFFPAENLLSDDITHKFIFHVDNMLWIPNMSLFLWCNHVTFVCRIWSVWQDDKGHFSMLIAIFFFEKFSNIMLWAFLMKVNPEKGFGPLKFGTCCFTNFFIYKGRQ